MFYEKVDCLYFISRNIRNDLSHLRILKTLDIKLFLKEYDNIIKLLKDTD